MKSELIAEKINAQEYWMPRDTPAVKAHTTTAHLHLLPGFDEYLLGYKDHNAILAREHASKIIPENNGVFLPTMIIEGRVLGTWKRTLRKNAVNIQLTPFHPT